MFRDVCFPLKRIKCVMMFTYVSVLVTGKTHKRNKSRFFPSSLHMSDPCFSVETKHTYCDMFEVLSSTCC
jgi:hypothetical protein